MVQPALKSFQMPDMPGRPPGPPSLGQRLEAETPLGTRTEPTVSSMAERFAPAGLSARQHVPRPAAGDAARPGRGTARRAALPARGVVVVLTAVAIAPAAILAGLLWLGAVRGLDMTFEFPGLGASPNQHAAVASTPGLGAAAAVPKIALTAPQRIAATAGEDVRFAIAIDAAEALPARSVIAIRDLPEGARFSEGRPYGAGEWSLRPDEIAGLTLRLPEDHTGATDLRVELVAADGAVLAGGGTRLDIAPGPVPGLTVRSGEADRVEDLMAHGKKMIAVGYLAGARACYERAAEAGSGAAALALGATYDPAFIAELGAQGIKPDPAAAKGWYDRAAALGVTDRDTQLGRLRRDWALDAEPPAKDDNVAVAEPEVATAPVNQPSDPRAEDRPGPLGRLVAAASELTGTDEWVVVSSAVNMREEASGTANTLKIMQAGAKLRVHGREGNWVQVADPASKQQGWIYRRFLKETEAP
jgi:hypothetical protein